MPLVVYLDSLLFMSELFGFVNSKHFCHIEDMKNNRSPGLNILEGSLMTKKTRLKWTLHQSKTWIKNLFQRKCSWKFELKISPEISHIFNWRILVCTIGCVKECSSLGWPQFCKFGKSPAYFGFNFKDGFRRNDLSILWMLTPPESFLCVKNDSSKDRFL